MSNLPVFIDQKSSQVPAFLQEESGGAGRENITSDMQSTPTLKLLQPLSREVTSGEYPALNWLLMDDVHESLYVSLLSVRRSFDLWYKRNSAKDGNAGHYETREDAEAALEENPDKAMLEIQETLILIGITYDEEGIGVPFQMFVSKTSLFPVKKMLTKANLLCEKIGGWPLYALVWNLRIKKESNTKGTWGTPEFDLVGQVDDEQIFDELKNCYSNIVQG